MADKFLDRLSKLLKLAENATTDAESSAYMAKAQELATTYELDLAVARQHSANKEERETPTMETFRLGESRTRGLFIQVDLISNLAYTNNVKLNVAHNSTYVVLFGFPSQIETIKSLFGSLVVQMKEASRKFIAEGSWNTGEIRYDYTTGSYKKPHALTERLSFEQGWVIRIGQRLRTARAETLTQVFELDAAEVPDNQSGAQVALRAVELEVKEFYTANSRTRGSYKGGSTKGSSDSYRAGGAAANSARIGSQKALA